MGHQRSNMPTHPLIGGTVFRIWTQLHHFTQWSHKPIQLQIQSLLPSSPRTTTLNARTPPTYLAFNPESSSQATHNSEPKGYFRLSFYCRVIIFSSLMWKMVMRWGHFVRVHWIVHLSLVDFLQVVYASITFRKINLRMMTNSTLMKKNPLNSLNS